VSAQAVIFITGTGRSGTNILKKILKQHSDIATLPFEYRFTVDPRGVFDFYNTFPAYWSPYWADAKIKDLESFLFSLANKSEAKSSLDPNVTPAPYDGWQLNKWIDGYENMVRDFISTLIEFKYPARWPGTPRGISNNQMYFCTKRTKESLTPQIQKFLTSCFDSICQGQGKSYLVEDNTHNLLFAASIEKTVPNGKLIHMMRDPRDVIASLATQRWAPNQLDQCINWYNEVLETWHAQRASVKSNFYIEVKFEDLINDPSDVLQRISGFAQFDFQDSMLNVDLSKHNMGRYKDQFNESEIEILNRGLSKWISIYEYA